MERLYIDNDHTVTLPDLTDETGAVVTDALVTLTLYASDEVTEVGGVAWPITLTHVADGTYQGALSREAEVTAGHVYKARVTATSGGKQLRGWRDAYAVRREL